MLLIGIIYSGLYTLYVLSSFFLQLYKWITCHFAYKTAGALLFVRFSTFKFLHLTFLIQFFHCHSALLSSALFVFSRLLLWFKFARASRAPQIVLVRVRARIVTDLLRHSSAKFKNNNQKSRYILRKKSDQGVFFSSLIYGLKNIIHCFIGLS